jgi:hypothetical protein
MHPAGLFEVVIDVAAAGFELVEVGFGLGGGFVGLGQGGDLLAQAIQFLLCGEGGLALIAQLAVALRQLLGQVAENSGVHQIRQGLGRHWPLQLEIVLVDPLHQQLDRAAGVEAGGARVAEGELLHFERLFVELRPLSSDQAVLGAHGMGGSSAEANGMQSGCIPFRLDAATRNQDAAVSPLI